MADFDRLRAARRDVAELTQSHLSSLQRFRAPGHAWFKVTLDEELQDKPVRHKTTTASCLESLDDVPPPDDEQLAFGSDGQAPTARDLVTEIAPVFASRALAQPDDEWESEDAAWVYCRVRTLPAIIRFAPDVAAAKHVDVARLLDYAWNRVEATSRRQGVYERPKLDDDGGEKQDPSYPPNAFHTFWALRALHMCEALSPLARIARKHKPRADIAVLWTQSILASQVALHAVKSDRSDPNQLAWALIAQFVNPADPAEPAASEFARRDLYKAALDAFFDQQLANGTWALGQPLFHYPRAGNAYCYAFETLTELLRPALYEKEGRLLRELLLDHVDDLMGAFEFARRSSRVGSDGYIVGWSSGHHPHRTEPEGWATAAVFSFSQCLRKLLGRWTHEQSARELAARQPQPSTRERALEELLERGDTWRGEERWSVGERISALFLHPRLAAEMGEGEPPDPDRALVSKNEARSAILFGPPGTSKTTLVEALAASLGWQFVEIRASDFLSRGMDHVPARADEIFDRLMELDHCVVLFDEIDELLRERQEAETDPFGRFLTTSMLPKVAQLWKQRRVLFFVATNDIVHADRAIKRSQRFDASLFVPPPSLAVKLARIRKIVSDTPDRAPRVKQAEVEDALQKDASQNPLGYLALLRFDQLDELGAKLRARPRGRRELENALREMGDQLRASDWHRPGSDAESDSAADPFRDFRAQRDAERRDFGKIQLAWVDARSAAPPPGFRQHRSAAGGTYWVVPAASDSPPGEVRVRGQHYVRDGLLRYSRRP